MSRKPETLTEILRDLGFKGRRPMRTIKALGGVERLNNMSLEARILLVSMALKASKTS